MKTWTLTLTPDHQPATTIEGIAHDDVRSILSQLVHGEVSAEQLAERFAHDEPRVEEPIAA